MYAKFAYGHLYPVHPLEIGDDMVDATLYDIEGGEHHLAPFTPKVQ